MTSQPDMQGLDPNALEAAAARTRSLTFSALTADEHRDLVEAVARAYRSALASLPQQTAEPRKPLIDFKLPGQCNCNVCLSIRRDTYERAHPASPPVGGAVKVKPLEWVEDGDGHWKASALTGTYHIVHKPGDLFQLRMSWSLMLYDAQCRSLDDAKAAAQADYETRILSALTSAERSGREAALIEAAEELLEYMDDYGYIGGVDVLPLRDAVAAIRNLAGTKTNE